MTIALRDYWMGRDESHREEWVEQIRTNGAFTVARVNHLLGIYESETGIDLSEVASGWRPRSVNEATSNSGAHSRHITAQACDVRDASGMFPRWCAKNFHQLDLCALWMEDWHWTPTWCHLQTIPPGSGRRMYYPFDPSNHPPAIPLGEHP